jgi:hypothetical protein
LNALQEDRVSPSASIEPGKLSLLVGRIGASRHFSRAPRLRAFLEYVMRHTFDGSLELLNEQSIGHAVFGRAVDYDPSADNIVRVEARELRKRLDAYFAEEGIEEAIVVHVPKGRYIAAFERRETGRKNVAADPAPIRADSAPSPAPPSRGGERRFLLAGLVGLALLLSVGNIYQLLRSPNSQPDRVGQSTLPLRVAAFWSLMFDAQRPALLTLSDSNLSLLQDLRGDSIPFADYTSGRYLAGLKERGSLSESDRILASIASRHYTGLGDASALARVLSLNRHHSPVVIRFARDLSIADLKSQNVVLLGSARSNPWVELLEKNQRFRIEYDAEANRPFLRDGSPEKGRPSVYMCGQVGEKPYEAYGIVVSAPNLDGTGQVILVAGTNMQGTEAAGEFLANPVRFEEFLKVIGWREDLKLPVFEVVLKLVTVGGSSISSEIFAYHIPKAE